MSWWVTLGTKGDDGEVEAVVVERHTEGGTYAVGGTNYAELNVTYNYGRVYRRVAGGNLVDMLDGKRAGDTIELMEKAVGVLGTERYADYWEPTDGNAGAALATLLGWARQYPDAIWQVH